MTTFATRPSMFSDLRSEDPAIRELRWADFVEKYKPILRQMALDSGLRGADADDLVGEFLLKWYARSKTFVYVPEGGRFRGFVATMARRLAWRLSANLRRQPPHPDGDVADERPDRLQTEMREVLMHHYNEERFQESIVVVQQKYESMGNGRTFECWQRCIDGEEPIEIADKLGISRDCVYQNKHKISRAIRREYEKRKREG